MAFGFKKQPVKQEVDVNNGEQLNAPSTSMEEITNIQGKVKRYIHQNNETGFVVALIELDSPQSVVYAGKDYGNLEEIVIVGSSMEMISNIKVGQSLSAWGKLALAKKNNALQFEFDVVKEPLPTSEKAIRIFLGSGKIKGLGPELARRIVDEFGMETLSVLSNTPDKLLNVRGISAAKQEKIIKSWKKWQQFYDVLSFLMEYGIGDVIATRIVEEYKENSLKIIKEDPYKLIELDGVGFKIADKIALKSGTSRLDDKRLERGIFYALEEIANKEGSTISLIENIETRAKEILSVSTLLIRPVIENLIEKKELGVVERRIDFILIN